MLGMTGAKARLSPALLLGRSGTISQLLFLLALRQHEVVIVAVGSPGSRRDFSNFDKLPIRHVSRLEAEVITNGRRNVQPRTMVQVWLRPLPLKHILKVVCPKRPAIFPLRITGPVPFPNGNPPVLAD